MRLPAVVAWAYALVLGACASPADGQQPPPSAVLSGTVYDSLGGGSLSGARVLLGGGLAAATTDGEGRFSLRAPPGQYTVTFSHPSLSMWGVLHHPATLRLEEGRTVRAALATASEETVLSRTCGVSASVVGGQVRDLLTLTPLAAATVQVDTRAGRGPRGQTLHTAGDGSWFACLPDAGAEVEVQARQADARGRPLRVEGAARVRVLDLYVQASQPAELQGLVLDGESGAPLADAAVEVMGTRLRTLTADDGRFRFRGVPPGAISLSVERLGYGRRVALVRAEGGSMARVTLELFAEAIAVDSVVVTVEGGVVDRNRLATRFDGLTREQIDALLPRAVAFDDLLRNANIPGLKVRDIVHQGASGIQQTGVCVELSRRSSLGDPQCLMVEVYLNDIRLSDAETLLQSLDPRTIDRVQLLTSTSAGVEYMGTERSRNGILLVWTRKR
ncbi:MAG: hypothetical protein AMXMBFR53_10220 [Gemmatimonadota bacterium]